MAKYYQVVEGEWVRLFLTKQRHICCSCSMVHEVDYKMQIKGKKKYLFARYIVNNRATSALRRNNKTPPKKKG